MYQATVVIISNIYIYIDIYIYVGIGQLNFNFITKLELLLLCCSIGKTTMQKCHFFYEK